MSRSAWEKLFVGCTACLMLAVIGILVYIMRTSAPLERLRDRFDRLAEGDKPRPVMHVVNAAYTSEYEAGGRKYLEDLRAVGPHAVDMLVEYLKSPSPCVRMLAADGLGRLRDGNSVWALTQALYDSDDDVVYEVARSLGRIGGPKAGEALLAKIRSGADERCVMVEDYSGKLWPTPRGAYVFPVFTTAVVAEELGNLRYEPAVGPLGVITESENEDIAEAAWIAIGRIGDDKALSVLTRSLSRLPVRGKWQAKALGCTGRREAVKPLVEAMKAGNSTAAEALGTLGYEEAIPALRSALSHPNEEVRVGAAMSLAQLHDREGIPLIRNLLDDESRWVQDWAREALRSLQIGGEASNGRHWGQHKRRDKPAWDKE